MGIEIQKGQERQKEIGGREMRYWEVRSRIYDSGRVKACVRAVEAEVKPNDLQIEHEAYDEWFDYFDSQSEATEFIMECQTEGAK